MIVRATERCVNPYSVPKDSLVVNEPLNEAESRRSDSSTTWFSKSFNTKDDHFRCGRQVDYLRKWPLNSQSRNNVPNINVTGHLRLKQVKAACPSGMFDGSWAIASGRGTERGIDSDVAAKR
jgi:hypothetical protein